MIELDALKKEHEKVEGQLADLKMEVKIEAKKRNRFARARDCISSS